MNYDYPFVYNLIPFANYHSIIILNIINIIKEENFYNFIIFKILLIF